MGFDVMTGCRQVEQESTGCLSLDVIKRRPLGALGSTILEQGFRIGIWGGG